MLRSLLTCLLIAAVLACPYQCLAGMVRAAEGEQQWVAACMCCHHERPAEDPATPAPEPASHDCFCQGATCEAPRDIAAEFAPQADALAQLLGISADHLSPALLASTAHTPPREALVPSGWEICVGQCALLL